MFCLQSHYRKPLTFSYDSLDNATVAYDKLIKRISALKAEGEPDMESAKPYLDEFNEALGNDLNTSLGLTAVYSVLKADISDATKLWLIEEFDKVLSLDLTKADSAEANGADDELAAEVEKLIAQRTEARANKDWATADAIRDKLKEMNVVLEDTKDGIKWHLA
jgi:cysteinyl-tRNA synthetase